MKIVQVLRRSIFGVIALGVLATGFAAHAETGVVKKAQKAQLGSGSDLISLIKNPSCQFLKSKSYELFTAKKQTYKLRRKVDFILVGKGQRKMILFSKGVPVKSYDVSLGFNPKGHKIQEADGRTPEGLYKINFKNPKSRFRLSLKVSYPNERDIANAERRGVKPGDNIMIHGEPNSPRARAELVRRQAANGGRYDWTYGCVAVKDWEIDEIYQVVDLETPILICK